MSQLRRRGAQKGLARHHAVLGDSTPADIAFRLTRWFAEAARDLPWRRAGTCKAYAALVSEAMLQQTQVSRVEEAFASFMGRFPTVDALAKADEQDVLVAWRGLGYYRRARNLHAAARAVMERFGGQVPRSPAELRTLPGVGRYTAGAIASIAYGVPVPAVDGNAVRVLLRIGGRAQASDDPPAVGWCWDQAERLVAAWESPGTLNEALMELGATVCTPAAPRCDECPLATACVARREELVAEIPLPKRRPDRSVVHHHAVAVVRGSHLLLEQRPERGLWARMWQVPTVESERPLSADALRDRLPLPVRSLTPVGGFVHLTTHRDIRFSVFVAESRLRSGCWVDVSSVGELPMSNAARRVVEMAVDAKALRGGG